MPLLTQYKTFFISPFGDQNVCDEMNQFLRSHRIVDIEKRLIDGERGTGYMFLVEYGSEEKDSGLAAAKNRVDYKELLTETEFALYDKFRNIRKELAERTKIPVYAIFTNEQLAQLAKKPPQKIEDIAGIKNVGSNKAAQYGKEILAASLEFLSRDGEQPPAEPEAAASDIPF